MLKKIPNTEPINKNSVVKRFFLFKTAIAPTYYEIIEKKNIAGG